MGKFGMDVRHNPSTSPQPERTTLPYVVSSRVRLARNLAAHRFPRLASDAERHAVLAQMQQVAASHPAFRQAQVVLLDDCSWLERMRLAEQYLISHLLATQGTRRAVILFDRLSASILVNEEDHLRIQAFSRGLRMQRAWKHAKFLAQSCEEMLDFAQSTPYCYLTTTPENSGTGLRASVMLFVPALILLKQIDRVIAACAASGYVARGMYGEGSSSAGFLLQLSCQRPQEQREQRILRALTVRSLAIIAQEQCARRLLLSRQSHVLKARFAWAGHHLRTARALDCQLGMTLIGWFRFGVAAGIPMPHCPSIANRQAQQRWLQQLDALQIHIQPAHIRQYCHDTFEDIAAISEDAEELVVREHTVRAALMRSVICPA